MLVIDVARDEPSPSGRLCPRCGIRPVEIMVVGEREGELVEICRKCRRGRSIPRFINGTLSYLRRRGSP